MKATKKSAPAPKKLTATAKVKLMTELLLALRDAKYHEPNSDYYEYCTGCHEHPNNPHEPGCFVPRIAEALRLVMGTCSECGLTGGHKFSCTCRAGRPAITL